MSVKFANSPATNNSPIAPMLTTVEEVAPVHSTNLNAAEKSSELGFDTITLADFMLKELQAALKSTTRSAQTVAMRIALEVERICQKSDRIQISGDVQSWQLTLARHRLQKCLEYYRLGSKQGRVELHSHLAAMIYRHVASFRANLNFQARYNMIEDFLQGFYIEALRAFRREHQMAADYTPRTQLELAEYMAFTEQYAKRQIGLPGRSRQRLIVLRAQGFAKGQPPETALDIEMAVESGKGEEAEAHSRSAAMQQVREQMVSESVDPAEAVLRDRVVSELIEYLQSQGQSECVDYLTLKLQDLSASDIDRILGLSPRQRDYLQQRFKYHVEKFARTQNWKLVHEWLGADLDQKLGMTSVQWEAFKGTLSEEQLQLLELKRNQENDKAIASALKCSPKQVQKRWAQLLDMASQCRNSSTPANVGNVK
ncbi:HetZ-related protein [Kamptonema sp. UHCC 0994]|uniref:HetZ-related protein n=1 Tax=Kamptonema sp. UHCC 0994 TaxID=3031329 RepID=UPI0023BADDD0|nr:HetZ-related protein [Kamptonema sp. UHCC 0994]MDF0556599.1 HetZ-related protein [Kamptonema sp. UHCC 0994]